MGSADRDVTRVAIVGAGPSGLFAAQALVGQSEVPVQVDLIDRLPCPYGLLRYGVAPDHTSIKSVANALARTFDSAGVRFLGNVEFGRDVDLIRDVLPVLFALTHALGEQILDLPVHRAEVILCPGGKGVVELRVQAQGHLLFGLCHQYRLPLFTMG